MNSPPREPGRLRVPSVELDGEHLPSLIMRWVAKERRQRAIVTDKLNLVWANQAFSKKVNDSKLMSLVEGRSLSFVQGQSEISNALERCGLEAEHIWIGSSDDGLLIQIVKLDQSSYYALEIVDQSPLPDNLEPILQAAFGLTNAENRVLVQMLLGEPADEIARSLGVSVETVRSHIKRIYDKLRVSSRERLFSRLLPFAALG